MVICQSANQLKTPAKVSLAFKMVSQFDPLGYTNPEATPKPNLNPILSSTFLGKVHCKHKECEHTEHTTTIKYVKYQTCLLHLYHEKLKY